ncbi:MAG: hypothetical protein RIS79_651 [Verrucomicrobiota bacterium]
MRFFTAWCHVAFALAGMVSASCGQTADDPGEGLRAELTATPGTTAIKWWGKSGRTYFVQTSETLQAASWQYMPVVENGAGSVCTYLLQTNAERMFVRLVHTDQSFSGNAVEGDFDSDGLTNAQEVAAGWGTSPFAVDSDGDGWRDVVEMQAGSSGMNGDRTPLTETLYYLDSIRSYDVGGLATTETITGYKNVSTWNRRFTWSYLGEVGPGTWSSGSKPNLEYKPWPDSAIGGDQHWSVTTNFWLNGSRKTGLPRPTWYDGYEYHSLVVSALQTQRSTDTNVDGTRHAKWGRFRLRLSKPLPFEYKEVFWEKVSTYNRPWSGANSLISSMLQRVTLTVPSGNTLGDWVYLTPNCEANQSVTYTPVHMTLSWEAKPGMGNVFTNYDPSWNQAVGARIDPDAPQSAPDSGFRRELNLRISANGMAGVTVYLKVFDVDDPSRISDPQHELDPNDTTSLRRGGDNITAAGTQPRGYFLPSTAKELAVTLDSSGSALVEFSVTPQPGNNYRVAMAFNEDDLDMLQVDDQREEGYVTADDGQPRGFAGIASPLLTVWRRLHIEVDMMQWYTGDKPAPDRMTATVTGVTSSGVVTFSEDLGQPDDFYQGGRIVSGGGQATINHSSGNQVRVGGFAANVSLGPCVLYDDDDTGLASDPLPRTQSIINTAVKDKFKPAYIDIMARTQGNTRPTLPFSLYSAGGYTTSLDDSQDTLGQDTDSFWNHTLVVAYQPAMENAGDPPEGTVQTGFSHNDHYPILQDLIFSAVFLEVVRDVNDGFYNANLPAAIDDVVAHEIGHIPGQLLQHTEAGLMELPSGTRSHYFGASTLRRLRKYPFWHSH